MIQKLPAQIIQKIIDHLLICAVSHNFENDDNVPGYICLQESNMIVKSKNLLNLACTCKNSKKIVYSNIYKFLACDETNLSYRRTPSEKYRSRAYFLPVKLYEKGQDDALETFGSVLNRNQKPRFYLSSIFENTPTDAF